MKRFVDAEAAYRQAIEIDPDFAYAHNGRGIALWSLGRFAEAEAAFRQAIEIDPGFAYAHNNLGNTLVQLGRFADAETAYRKAAEIAPDLTHYGLGNTLVQLGRFAEAETAYRKAVKIAPDAPRGYRWLGALVLFTGRLHDAKAVLKQAGPAADAELLRWVADRAVSSSVALKCEPDSHTPDTVLAALAESWSPWVGRPSLFALAEIRALAVASQGDGAEAVRILRAVIDDRLPGDRFMRPLYDLLALPEPIEGLAAVLDVWREIIAADPSAAGPWGGPGSTT
ncbi:tetratricopeptide repeat protein [Streptosporangium sp. NPDC048865]|uniref:tetratricopeptide repeat protein n=1 Tax=Streptosporangium sp. NPDC048865 TaxID=3155766 RepID=UPI003448A7EA